ncbi:manganese peroxidase precursor [Exidia glandulosa HHB12029]|uniref:Peroxidase n=1 Tax=Exidia glandulosa HHB12029 TaxID=1314781 RepID=A0A165CV46_EXIGL|nr:manganese peroxidase precursor [Exidia glandulosa HHB12029]
MLLLDLFAVTTSFLGLFFIKTVAAQIICPIDGTVVNNFACCPFVAVKSDLLANVFDGTCGANAAAVIRLAFSDAIGFSINTDKGGGADGSIITFPVELTFPQNVGLDCIVKIIDNVAGERGVSRGDAIHFAASIALSLCPGAPVVQTFVGRPEANRPAAPNTIPNPFDPANTIFARMQDAGFSPTELVALLAAHSIGSQHDVDPTIPGAPFDTTPGSFDSQFFLETLLRGTLFPGDGPHQGEATSPLPGEFRLQSDFTCARDPRTACTWQSFVSNQTLMAARFATAMAKLTLLGQDVLTLTDCTELIPRSPPAASQAVFPATKSRPDIDQACAISLFPSTLKTLVGPEPTVLPVPPQSVCI